MTDRRRPAKPAKAPPPHIPRGQVQRGQVKKGTVPKGQIDIRAPPEAKDAVRCPTCGTAMSWEPFQQKWYCQTCMIYYDP